MRHSFISALLAFASLARAQVDGFDAMTAPTKGQVATVGSNLDIVWQPQDVTGPITITLLQGADAATLQLGQVVVAGLDNQVGTYSWAIPSTVGSFATYGFQITLDADPAMLQYSFPFVITGGSASTAPSAESTYAASSPVDPSAPSSGSISSSSSSQTSTTTMYLTQVSSSYATVTATSSAPYATVSNNATSNSTATKSIAGTNSASVSATGLPHPTANAAVKAASGGLAIIGGLLIAVAL